MIDWKRAASRDSADHAARPGLEASQTVNPHLVLSSAPRHPSARIESAIDVRPSPHDHVLAQLNARGFIQFHPVLAARLGGFKAALLLGHALYWSRHLAFHEAHRRGWFFMTARQWQDATGLSQREQATVRTALVTHGVLREALAGQPAKLHFKVDLPAVVCLAGLEQQGDPSWEVLTPLLHQSVRFYKPLADVAGSVSGGLYLSHLLQLARQALQQPSPFLATGDFVIQPSSVAGMLGLGPKTLRNTREKLKAAGLLHEGVFRNERQAVRLNLAAIAACLAGQPAVPLRQTRRTRTNAAPDAIAMQRPAATELGAVPSRTPNAASQAHHPSRAQLSLLCPPTTVEPRNLVASASVGGEVPIGSLVAVVTMFAGPTVCASALAVDMARPPTTSTDDANDRTSAPMSKLRRPFVETGLPFGRNIQGVDQVSNTTTTAPASRNAMGSDHDTIVGCRRRIADKTNPVERFGDASAPPSGSVDAVGSSLEGLVFPRTLDTRWRPAILNVLRAVEPAERQVLLDELSGQLDAPGRVIFNPPGWLLTLDKRSREGRAVFAFADKVRLDREARLRAECAQTEALERAKSGATVPAAGASQRPPEPNARREAEVRKLRSLKADLMTRTQA